MVAFQERQQQFGRVVLEREKELGIGGVDERLNVVENERHDEIDAVRLVVDDGELVLFAWTLTVLGQRDQRLVHQVHVRLVYPQTCEDMRARCPSEREKLLLLLL